MIKMETDTDIAATVGSTVLEFAYDWRGRRISKTVYGALGSYEHCFIYDGWNVLAEAKINRGGPFIEHIVREYTWGLDLSGTMQGEGGVGGLLAVKKTIAYSPPYSSYETLYPSYDGNGNILAWSKKEYPALQKLVYDPFGNVISKHGTPSSGDVPFGFSTKYTDEETGLCYYGYRYYDPVTGRWPSRDPIGEEGGWNLYSMTGNDAVNGIDLLGLAVVSDNDGSIVVPNQLPTSNDEVPSILPGDSYVFDTTTLDDIPEDSDSEYDFTCKGSFENVNVAAVFSGVFFEWGSFDLSWYGIGTIKACTHVSGRVTGDLVCSECCPYSGGPFDLTVPISHKVCIEIEIPWLLLVKVAGMAGAPVPGTRVMLTVGISAMVARTTQRVGDAAQKYLPDIKRYHDRIEERIENDTYYATKLCNEGGVPNGLSEFYDY